MCFVALHTAQAQESTSTEPVLSDSGVFITPTITNEDESAVTVTLNFENNTDVDFENLRYGFSLVDVNDEGEETVVEQVYSNERFSLASGETRESQSVYFKPDFLTGNYLLHVGLYDRSTTMVSGATIGGLALSRSTSTLRMLRDTCTMQDAGATADGAATVAPASVVTVACDVENDLPTDVNINLFVRTLRQSVFGDVVSMEPVQNEVTVPAGTTESIDFTFTAPTTPQTYVSELIIEAADSFSDSDFIEYQVEGNFTATINSVDFTEQAYQAGEPIAVAVDWEINDWTAYQEALAAPTASGSEAVQPGVRAELSARSGNTQCIEPVTMLLGSTQPFTLSSEFIADCAVYDLSVSLYDNADNVTLDYVNTAVAAEDTTVVADSPTPEPTSSETNRLIVIAAITLLALFTVMILVTMLKLGRNKDNDDDADGEMNDADHSDNEDDLGDMEYPANNDKQ